MHAWHTYMRAYVHANVRTCDHASMRPIAHLRARECGRMHCHAGFDILTYMKEGRGSHADSLGNVAVVRPGGIQWMRTGSGIEHAEGGGNPEGINKHGFQIWVSADSFFKRKPHLDRRKPRGLHRPEGQLANGGVVEEPFAMPPPRPSRPLFGRKIKT